MLMGISALRRRDLILLYWRQFDLLRADPDDLAVAPLRDKFTSQFGFVDRLCIFWVTLV